VKCRSTRSGIAADSSHCRVDPSMSVNRNVRVVAAMAANVRVTLQIVSTALGVTLGTELEDGRRRRSQRTRARVVAAAQHLFLEHGYLATTIEAVAASAGVAVQTVYHAVGTKHGLLAAVLDATIAGDAEPVAIVDRPWADELAGAPGAAAAVAQMVAGSVAIVARTAPLLEVVHRAAADPEVAALLADTRRRRRADQRALVTILATAGHLPPTHDVTLAADVVYGLLNEEVFQLLTVDCGWDVERFQRWVTAVLLDQLGIGGAPR
jgi:AcrR family transcriptional regulator